MRTHGYQPRLIYERNAELKLVLDQLRDGIFSSDRTIAEYAGQIWHAAPIKL